MADSTINIFGNSGEAMVGADTINTILASMDSKLTSDDINIETLGDGTVDVDVKNDTYTINLNHTHEGMAKIVKCTEATLPQTLADDTIYVQVDNLTTPTEIEALHLFGLEFTGGGLPAGAPQITSPKSTIPFNLGTAYGQGGATGTVQVKGKNLTANSSLTVSVGSGFSLSYGQQSGSSVTISEADATIGVDVDVFATAYGTSGTLLIASQTDNINHAVDLTSDIELAGVKLTGTQWMQTDYKPNANTEFVMTCQFIQNSISLAQDGMFQKGYIFQCPVNSGDGKRFMVYQVTAESGIPYNAFGAFFINESEISYSGHNQTVQYATQSSYNDFLVDNLKMFYRKSASNGVFGFNSNGTEKTITTSLKSSTMESPMVIGKRVSDDTIYSRFDLVIKELKITEGGVVVRDWVPKMINGVPGLLDIAANGNGTFLSSETAKTSGLASDELVPVYPSSNNN